MQRYLKKFLREDLKRKMVFICGPRQVGKTSLAQDMAPKRHRYLNWDIPQDREFLLQQHFPVEKFVILDEIHKFKLWRGYLKGLYDKYRQQKKILVTGSAKLDYYRYSGDSLQGRYHLYRLHPLSVGELGIQTDKDFQELLKLGGFPEPFFSSSQRQAMRWRREYRQRVVNEDISSLEMGRQLGQMELLQLRLPHLVGSPLSINSLRQDLQLAHKTVAKYLDIFERMYLIYSVHPFNANNLRSVKKERKHYHYNWAEVPNSAARFENLIAGHLLKWVHFRQDYHGEDLQLNYFRDTDKREIDFIISQRGVPLQAIECKLQERGISHHLKYFKKKFPDTECIQVHRKISGEYLSKEGIRATDWRSFLRHLV